MVLKIVAQQFSTRFLLQKDDAPEMERQGYVVDLDRQSVEGPLNIDSMVRGGSWEVPPLPGAPVLAKVEKLIDSHFKQEVL